MTASSAIRLQPFVRSRKIFFGFGAHKNLSGKENWTLSQPQTAPITSRSELYSMVDQYQNRLASLDIFTLSGPKNHIAEIAIQLQIAIQHQDWHLLLGVLAKFCAIGRHYEFMLWCTTKTQHAGASESRFRGAKQSTWRCKHEKKKSFENSCIQHFCGAWFQSDGRATPLRYLHFCRHMRRR